MQRHDSTLGPPQKSRYSLLLLGMVDCTETSAIGRCRAPTLPPHRQVNHPTTPHRPSLPLQPTTPHPHISNPTLYPCNCPLNRHGLLSSHFFPPALPPKRSIPPPPPHRPPQQEPTPRCPVVEMGHHLTTRDPETRDRSRERRGRRSAGEGEEYESGGEDGVPQEGGRGAGLLVSWAWGSVVGREQREKRRGDL